MGNSVCLIHLGVEAARAKEGLVQVLRPVGGAQHDDALVRHEAVHLGEELEGIV